MKNSKVSAVDGINGRAIHPATARRVFNINQLHSYGIVGMEQDEANPLLEIFFLSIP